MIIDWDKIREQFPAAQNGIYLMTAAAGPIATPVYEALLREIKMMHETGDVRYMDSIERLAQTRGFFAEYLNCKSSDIGFCPNTSHGMGLIAKLFRQKLEKLGEPLGEILMPDEEFPATSIPWMHEGFDVKFCPVDAITASITAQTQAVVTSAIQYSTGYRQNLESLGASVASRGLPFIVNATQAIGVFPTDVERAKISALTASCHKWLCGNYGTSALFVSESFRAETEWPLLGWLSVTDCEKMDNRNATGKLDVSAVETGILPFTVLAGLNVAIRQTMELGIENIAERVHFLSGKLESAAREKGFRILSKRDAEPDWRRSINSGTVMIEADNSDVLVEKLIKKKVYVSARRGGLRLAIHYFNNEADIAGCLKAIHEAINLSSSQSVSDPS